MPICDGYEAAGKAIAVLGYGARDLGEAVFVARTYSQDVTLLTLGQKMDLEASDRERITAHGVKVVYEPIASLDIDNGHIAVLRTGSGAEYRFDVL